MGEAKRKAVYRNRLVQAANATLPVDHNLRAGYPADGAVTGRMTHQQPHLTEVDHKAAKRSEAAKRGAETRRLRLAAMDMKALEVATAVAISRGLYNGEPKP